MHRCPPLLSYGNYMPIERVSFGLRPGRVRMACFIQVNYADEMPKFTFYSKPTFAISDGSQTGPLPTPPGSESSFDNQFLLHGHNQKSSDAFTNLVSTYGGYPTSMDYHNAMTPPSSVSPREPSNTSNNNKQSGMHPSANNYDFSDSLRSQYASSVATDTPTLPLKPQPYSAAAAMHHAANSIEAYGGIDQSQYFSHHSGFHLYHKGTPSAGWYTTPS